ncbi:MAG TPA: hypothetical protein VE988_28795 [Gemmataceae bacterium]|nr:hypothetical protein [Gemmataceae bacterium]
MKRNGYTFLREATLREVLEHFVKTEVTRNEYANCRGELQALLACEDRTFFKRMRKFADDRDDVNPTLTWTIGTHANKHHERVQHWVLAEVTLDSLYSCGINPAMQADLDRVNGHLASFAEFAQKYPEFQNDSVPQGDQRIIIAIAKTEVSKKGTLEVVDGSHRGIAMLAKKIGSTSAFVAELKPER